MKLPATCAGLLIAAGAAFFSAPAAVAAPLAGPLALGQASTATTEQVQYRRYRSYRRGYGAYASARGFGRRGCIRGDSETTSAYPSWMVCHARQFQR